MTKPTKGDFLPLAGVDLVSYGQERARDVAFDAVRKLWDQRKEEGWTQKDIAYWLGKDEAWVSRALSHPGNWTMKTFGALVAALDGDFEIKIYKNETRKAV